MLDVMNAYRAEKTQTTSGEVSHAMLDDLSSMAGGSLGTETMWLFNTSCVISEWGEETVLGLEADFENYDGSKTSGVRYFQMKRVCELLEGEQYYLATFPLQKELNFHVLLPKEGTDYSSVMEENADALFSLSAPLNYMANVSLTLPEFDISTTLSSLSDILAADSHLQTSETAQSYPGIVSSAAGNKFSIASFACSEIQVKSTGITASSAISGGYLFPLSGEWEGPRVHLRADHPFLFALTNSDGLPLYAGQLAKINQKDGI